MSTFSRRREARLPGFFVRQRGRRVLRIRDADPSRRRQGTNPGMHAGQLELEGELLGRARRPRGRFLFEVVEAVRLEKGGRKQPPGRERPDKRRLERDNGTIEPVNVSRQEAVVAGRLGGERSLSVRERIELIEALRAM